MEIRFPERLGDFVEQKLGEEISRRYEAPVLEGMPKSHMWYRIPLEQGVSGDGSGYHIYLKMADPGKLALFFSGGGVAWNAYTAARPVTGGKMAAGLPNYYWSNLRPVTQIMNINSGITMSNYKKNPMNDWSFLIITYATGDFHIGNADYAYIGENGQGEVLHFHGYQNVQEAMQIAKYFVPKPDKLLIAGDSAGAFAVPAYAGIVANEYYPECRDIMLFSDSGQLLSDHWRKIAKRVWGAKPEFWKRIHGSNLTLEWYADLYRQYQDRFQYLYASSTHDFLLSAYQNDMVNQTYVTDA